MFNNFKTYLSTFFCLFSIRKRCDSSCILIECLEKYVPVQQWLVIYRTRLPSVGRHLKALTDQLPSQDQHEVNKASGWTWPFKFIREFMQKWFHGWMNLWKFRAKQLNIFSSFSDPIWYINKNFITLWNIKLIINKLWE